MDGHPLNLAHQQYRRAEAHMKNNRYDDAMQCHQSAAELLLDAMKSTTSTFALESITLQHSYHLKQKDIIKSKKEQYVRVKKAMENMKCLSIDPNLNLMEKDHNKLQVEIFKVMNESETLLHSLSLNVEQSMEPPTIIKNFTTDIKNTKKTQQTVVEELQILSQNLYSLVEQLVLQVEVLKDENTTLKDKVNYLEKERMKYLNISSQDFDYSSEHPSLSNTIESYAQSSNQINTADIGESTLNNSNR